MKYFFSSSFLYFFSLLNFGIFSMFFLSSCTPAVVTAGIASISASESEKGLGTSINDTLIHASITEVMFKTDVNIFIGVNITVNDGTVLLTGKVKEPQTRIEATRLSWKIRGVKEVINEIQVSESSSIKDAAKDLAAATTLRTKLVSDKNISSVNFNIDVVNGIIFVSGIAKTQAEMDLVLSHAKETKYTNQLVNYIKLVENLSQ